MLSITALTIAAAFPQKAERQFKGQAYLSTGRKDFSLIFLPNIMLQDDLQSYMDTSIPSHQWGFARCADTRKSIVSFPAQPLHFQPFPIPSEMIKAPPLALANSRIWNLPAAPGLVTLWHSFHPGEFPVLAPPGRSWTLGFFQAVSQGKERCKSPPRFESLEVNFNLRNRTGVPRDTDYCRSLPYLTDRLPESTGHTAWVFVTTYGQWSQVAPW